MSTTRSRSNLVCNIPVSSPKGIALFSEGVIGPPVVGKFEGNVGRFEGSDTYKGVPVLVRYVWTVNPQGLPATAVWEQKASTSGSPIVAKWEQAFSKDGGKTWETNWYNEFIRDDNCTLTSARTAPVPAIDPSTDPSSRSDK